MSIPMSSAAANIIQFVYPIHLSAKKLVTLLLEYEIQTYGDL